MAWSQTVVSRYCRLVWELGVRLKRGQKVRLVAEREQRLLVHELVRSGLTHGASYIKVDWIDSVLDRIALDHTDPSDLNYFPQHLVDTFQEMLRDRWASVFLKAPNDPKAFEGADPERMAIGRRTRADKLRFWTKAQMALEVPWTIIPAPSQAWADLVYGGPDSLEQLEADLVLLLKLDQPDPVEAWKTRGEELLSRCRALTDARFDRLHFQGPGTDLLVGLTRQSRWLGGPDEAPNGEAYLVNLPTEEVFTTPDWRRTEGRVACTRPVEVSGSLLNGIRFEFQGGRAVKTEAEGRGTEVLKAFLDTDPQASFLGEVALVDIDSPIFKTGRVFQSILLDENAACHIALGSGYPAGQEGTEDLDGSALLEHGCNQASLHLDFMIGSPEVDVTGITLDGQKVELLKKGVWVYRR